MEYYNDIFYKTNKLTKKSCIDLFKEAKDLCDIWWVDQHNEHSIRKKIDRDFDEIISIFNKTKRSKLHIVFIHRRGRSDWAQYLEIGFCTLSYKDKNGEDIFLWIDVDINKKEYLINKYSIHEML